MKRPVSFILAAILLMAYSGCIWEHDRGWHGERDQRRHDDRDHDRGDRDWDRRDDRRGYDDRRY